MKRSFVICRHLYIEKILAPSFPSKEMLSNDETCPESYEHVPHVDHSHLIVTAKLKKYFDGVDYFSTRPINRKVHDAVVRPSLVFSYSAHLPWSMYCIVKSDATDCCETCHRNARYATKMRSIATTKFGPAEGSVSCIA